MVGDYPFERAKLESTTGCVLCVLVFTVYVIGSFGIYSKGRLRVQYVSPLD